MNCYQRNKGKAKFLNVIIVLPDRVLLPGRNTNYHSVIASFCIHFAYVLHCFDMTDKHVTILTYKLFDLKCFASANALMEKSPRGPFSKSWGEMWEATDEPE
jgi:hypothetical protein